MHFDPKGRCCISRYRILNKESSSIFHLNASGVGKSRPDQQTATARSGRCPGDSLYHAQQPAAAARQRNRHIHLWQQPPLTPPERYREIQLAASRPPFPFSLPVRGPSTTLVEWLTRRTRRGRALKKSGANMATRCDHLTAQSTQNGSLCRASVYSRVCGGLSQGHVGCEPSVASLNLVGKLENSACADPPSRQQQRSCCDPVPVVLQVTRGTRGFGGSVVEFLDNSRVLPPTIALRHCKYISTDKISTSVCCVSPARLVESLNRRIGRSWPAGLTNESCQITRSKQ